MKIKSSFKDYNVSFQSFDIEKEVYDCYIVDENVYRIYKSHFKNITQKKLILIEANEKNKSYKRCFDYINQLIEAGVKRGNTICAIGGGVIQDIVGFVSSILYRGLKWVFYPTTLLSQCDSCIGGKTSINLDVYKNIVGNFNPPENIIIDLNFLKTLETCDIQSGIGEIIKVYFIDKENRISHDKLKECIDKNFVDEEIILSALKIKKEIIEIDEFDKGIRNIMNYGHTFGHAIETMTNFEIPHGIAVGIGIDIANRVSLKSNASENLVDQFEVLKTYRKSNDKYYQIFSDKFDLQTYLNALSKDKKNLDSNSINCILAKKIGELSKIKFESSDLKRILLEIGIENYDKN